MDVVGADGADAVGPAAALADVGKEGFDEDALGDGEEYGGGI